MKNHQKETLLEELYVEFVPSYENFVTTCEESMEKHLNHHPVIHPRTHLKILMKFTLTNQMKRYIFVLKILVVKTMR